MKIRKFLTNVTANGTASLLSNSLQISFQTPLAIFGPPDGHFGFCSRVASGELAGIRFLSYAG